MIVAALILLGLVLGSFVNALVWRLHKGKEWVKDRSECVHCGHKLGPGDLIPIISWLWLRGKCRYCRKKIDDSPLTELALPILFVTSYFFWPTPLQGSSMLEFGLWLVFLVGFVALALYDLRWYLLPDRLVFPLIGLAVLQVVVLSVWNQDWRLALTAAAGAMVISGLFYLLFRLSNETWIGGGDVKLGIVLGLLAGGVLQSFLLLFAASFIGVLAAIPLIIQGKAHRHMQLPFGPLLIAGLILVKLFGATVIGWYTNLFYV